MIAVIATSLEDGGGSETRSPSSSSQVRNDDDRKVPKSYVVQSGDTLTSIARETGVPVAIILKLNPGVDPQILISGEKLELR